MHSNCLQLLIILLLNVGLNSKEGGRKIKVSKKVDETVDDKIMFF